MKKLTSYLFTASYILITFLIFSQDVLAGPGGNIANAAFRSFWGKLFLVIIGFILLPLLLYFWFREYRAVNRTIKDLKALSIVYPEFNWMVLKERISSAFYQVHSAWRKEDMQRAEQWMTSWFWQNQQMAFLDQWEQYGLVNHCQVKNIKSLKPLFVQQPDNKQSSEGSRLVVLISAEMEDYLAERETGKVVEGKKGFAEVDTVWTFLFENGKWVVSNIEERDSWYSYAKMPNEVAVNLTPPVISQTEVVEH